MDESDSKKGSSISCQSSGCLDDINSDSDDEVQRHDCNVVPLLNVIVPVTVGSVSFYSKYIEKHLVHMRPYSGWAFIQDLINGRDVRSSDMLRMKPEVFINLCQTLVEDYGLEAQPYVNVEEQVATFMMLVGPRVGNRLCQEYLQRSRFTISGSFHNVLTALTKMSMDWVKPFEDFNTTPSQIEENPRYYPHFKMVLILMHVYLSINNLLLEAAKEVQHKIVWWLVISINVSHLFYPVGKEVHMTRAFSTTRFGTQKKDSHCHHLESTTWWTRATLTFPGSLAPYKGERYHQPDFESNPRHNNHKEAFNHVHTSLRSICNAPTPAT